MWQDLEKQELLQSTDDEINKKYAQRELRIVTETNREQLPNFVAALQRSDWMRLQPFYQRRKRWDDKRKSKLIESFIMNIPVPPCFLYESDFARYEVMDGQQRITAILDFYTNKYKLKGLEQWPELNGKIYDKLPSEIKKGLDRRSISYIVLLKESATGKDQMLLRQQVFERLNTGGIELENQEIRHCIYHNEFDLLLIELSRHPLIRKAWDLPLFGPEEEINPPESLLSKPHYSKMRDVEFMLRFFALRHIDNYRGGMQSFLDQYMVRSSRFTNDDISQLRLIFEETIQICGEIYGDVLFKPWQQKTNSWAKIPQVAFADAVAYGVCCLRDRRDEILAKKDVIVKNTKKLILESDKSLFTGQGNTKKDIETRLSAYRQMLVSTIG